MSFIFLVFFAQSNVEISIDEYGIPEVSDSLEVHRDFFADMHSRFWAIPGIQLGDAFVADSPHPQTLIKIKLTASGVRLAERLRATHDAGLISLDAYHLEMFEVVSDIIDVNIEARDRENAERIIAFAKVATSGTRWYPFILQKEAAIFAVFGEFETEEQRLVEAKSHSTFLAVPNIPTITGQLRIMPDLAACLWRQGRTEEALAEYMEFFETSITLGYADQGYFEYLEVAKEIASAIDEKLPLDLPGRIVTAINDFLEDPNSLPARISSELDFGQIEANDTIQLAANVNALGGWSL